MKVSKDKSIKSTGAEHSIERGEVLRYGTDQSKPILPVVNLKAFERREPHVGTDVACGDLGGRFPVVGCFPHLEVGGQRSAHIFRHTALKFEEVHASASSSWTGTTSAAGSPACRKRLAFRASVWTSSNEGILSSHSSRVAVGPQRSMARA